MGSAQSVDMVHLTSSLHPEQHPAFSMQVGCGADELIDLLMRCVLDPGDCIVDTPPTFTMYAFDAAVNDARVVTVPRRADFSIDVPGPPLCFQAAANQLLAHFVIMLCVQDVVFMAMQALRRQWRRGAPSCCS